MALLFNRKENAAAYTDNITMGEHPEAVVAISLLDDDIINELAAVFRVYHNKAMLDAKAQPVDEFNIIFTEKPQQEGFPTYHQAVELLKGGKGEIAVSEQALEYAFNSIPVYEAGQPIPLGQLWDLTDLNYKGVVTPEETQSEEQTEIQETQETENT